jgi:hypothetical protein
MLGPQSSKEDASLLAKFREHPDATGEADTSTEDGGPNECDLVLKGGITSGLVYPYALLELAKAYRFRSIGGASAGGIAAAFAAAAEYARTVRGDPGGFDRLRRWCDKLPEILPTLFQPRPPFRSVMAWLVRAQAAGTVWAALFWLIVIFWGTALAGIVCAGGLLWWLGAGPWGAAAGSILGLLLAFGLRAWRLAAALPDHGFGFCPGAHGLAARCASGHRLRTREARKAPRIWRPPGAGHQRAGDRPADGGDKPVDETASHPAENADRHLLRRERLLRETKVSYPHLYSGKPEAIVPPMNC